MKNINKVTRAFIFGAFLITTCISCKNASLDEVKADTKKPVAKFEVSAERFKAEERIVFTDQSTDQDGFITSWSWDFGNGERSAKQSPEYFYAQGGVYTVTLIVIDNTGSASVAVSKEVSIEKSLTGAAPIEIWSYTLPGKLDHSSPALSDDGTLYIGFNQAKREDAGPNFIAIKTGRKVWDQVFLEGSANKSDKMQSSPSISSTGTVYTASFFSRKIFRVNASTGVIEGNNNIDARIRYSCPVFASDGTVYVGGYSKAGKGFYSLNSSLSTSSWVFKPGEDFNSTPAIGSDGTIFVSSSSGSLYAVNADGTARWSAPYGTSSTAAIALGGDGTVYFAGNEGSEGLLIAFDPDDGTEKWRKVLSAQVNQGGPSVAVDGTIYIGGSDQKIRAYNPDGSEKWAYTANGEIETVPAIDNDGNLYFGDLAGFFHVVNSEGGKARKATKLGDEINSSAVIGSDGTIYVAANDGDFGKVYALKTDATNLAQGGWPMYAKDAKHTGR